MLISLVFTADYRVHLYSFYESIITNQNIRNDYLQFLKLSKKNSITVCLQLSGVLISVDTTIVKRFSYQLFNYLLYTNIVILKHFVIKEFTKWFGIITMSESRHWVTGHVMFPSLILFVVWRVNNCLCSLPGMNNEFTHKSHSEGPDSKIVQQIRCLFKIWLKGR